MSTSGYIADFNMSDGLPPLVVQKLNANFRNVGGGRRGGGAGGGAGSVFYADLPDKPSIESVELVGNKTFPDLGIFKTDEQGYDVPDDYTLTSSDINSLWANAVPIALGA